MESLEKQGYNHAEQSHPRGEEKIKVVDQNNQC